MSTRTLTLVLVLVSFLGLTYAGFRIKQNYDAREQKKQEFNVRRDQEYVELKKQAVSANYSIAREILKQSESYLSKEKIDELSRRINREYSDRDDDDLYSACVYILDYRKIPEEHYKLLDKAAQQARSLSSISWEINKALTDARIVQIKANFSARQLQFDQSMGQIERAKRNQAVRA